jgi:hypothetical protein
MIKGKTVSRNVKARTRKKSFLKSTERHKPILMKPEGKHHRILEAAYYRAEKRGFLPGAELDDWLAAEVEIERSLRGIPFKKFEHLITERIEADEESANAPY